MTWIQASYINSSEKRTVRHPPTPDKRVLRYPNLEDILRTVDSERYGQIDEPKDLLGPRHPIKTVAF